MVEPVNSWSDGGRGEEKWLEWERGKAGTRSWKVSVGEMVGGEEGGTLEKERDGRYVYARKRARDTRQRDRRRERAEQVEEREREEKREGGTGWLGSLGVKRSQQTHVSPKPERRSSSSCVLRTPFIPPRTRHIFVPPARNIHGAPSQPRGRAGGDATESFAARHRRSRKPSATDDSFPERILADCRV